MKVKRTKIERTCIISPPLEIIGFGNPLSCICLYTIYLQNASTDIFICPAFIMVPIIHIFPTNVNQAP
jgi:hypothetical protein